ncbi:MAG: hybrid sensor histidine kinase/response regulator [Betaproteobacteria bacterium]|nr:hybrid sensor histidine kinase/response regulator [Betaproteobacteria bacterium]
MITRDEDFRNRLLATFAVEAEEHLAAISAGLLALEKAPSARERKDLVEAVFREAHSLKGAARAVNLAAIESVCQPMESVFAALKRGNGSLSPPLFDLIHEAVGVLRNLVAGSGAAGSTAEQSSVDSVVRRLEAASRRGSMDEPAKATTVQEPGPEEDFALAETGGREVPPDESRVHLRPAERLAREETVRVSTAKLDSMLRQAEELVSAKLTAMQRLAELRRISVDLGGRKKARENLRPRMLGVQAALEPGRNNDLRAAGVASAGQLLEFLDQDGAAFASLENAVAKLAASAEQDSRTLAKMVENLLEDAKKVLMLPFSWLLDGFPPLVRDLSRDRGREVELIIGGAEIEIDRRILEEMKDPLIHLIRNCVDHGIEPPKERVHKGKSPRGTITVTVSQKDAGKAEITVSDDGTGIDLGKIRVAAQKLGIVSAEEASRLGDQETLSLAFRSGVSTSPILTEISGRGLGLAIVQEKVEKLGGTVFIETRRDGGTTFRVVVPLTLAAFRGVVVRVREQLLAVPTVSVERVARVSEEDIKTVENRETLQINGRAISLVRLGDILGLPPGGTPGESTSPGQVVVLSSGGEHIAFLVDEIVNEQEVLVKGLGKQLSRVPNVAGASMLGTGVPVPILSVPDLMKSAVMEAVSPMPQAKAQIAETPQKSVLVVEDSITARTLLKNILEAAGYRVRTAVDGVDALTTLKTEGFDLVVSDIEMPRMDGFDLTTRIRADKKLAEVPVVLVTALESREHRERGIDVGANAYIVKSSFDQSNLLAVIRQLI